MSWYRVAVAHCTLGAVLFEGTAVFLGGAGTCVAHPCGEIGRWGERLDSEVTHGWRRPLVGGIVAIYRRDIRIEENEQRDEVVRKLVPIAQDLVGWEPAALKLLPLEEIQIQAILTYRKTSGRRGKSRQMQYIVSILVPSAEELFEAVGQGTAPSIVAVTTEQVEQAHLALIMNREGAVERALAQWPALERQRLRQLARAASKEKHTVPLRASSAKLLRYLEQAAGLVG